ncbi:TonB-dependent receptor [Beijerinckia indica]|uniref:TonB-dependent receptor n=1 Tax=Beijerinckia indica subsp. indica (strain ATCC 9039 / DSM 1715 / NCIMB 8712) TaxID=395963 RepID=B2IF10_BEII9|nr:TonB-dependent receptor [Beijerinckia indica]ACB94201.1 TonB-dependent receptor [Beijerinckia indica subsp. indica ATCC 9039]
MTSKAPTTEPFRFLFHTENSKAISVGMFRGGHPVHFSCLTFCLYIATMSAAKTQESSANEATLQDVVVTGIATPDTDKQAFSKQQATQRQFVPSSSTIITKQQLDAAQVRNVLDAQRLQPGLRIRFTNVRNLSINIRGFGASSSSATDGIFNGVPVYIDGILQPRVGQALFDVPDLDGIEVLKGPQATSGGMDNTGGVVNLTTTLPSFATHASAEVSYGRYNWAQFKGSLTGAVGDSTTTAFRLAAFGSDRDGYVSNYNGGQKLNDFHDKGMRGQILWQPTEDLTARFIVDYAQISQACCGQIYNGGIAYYVNGQPIPNNFYNRAARIGLTPPPANALSSYMTDNFGYQNTSQESYGAAAIVDYNLPDGYHFNSVTSFRGWDFHPHNFGDAIYVGLPTDLTTRNNSHVTERSVQQEFKISTPKGQPVEGTAGLFYLYEQLYNWGLSAYGSQAGLWYGKPTDSAAVNNTLNYTARESYDNPTTHYIAPYAQATWHVDPEFDLTAGLRYSYVYKTTLYRQWQNAWDTSYLSPADQAASQAARNTLLGSPRQFTASTHQGLISALASASYKFAPDVMGYVTFARSGRPGGPNPANLPVGAPTTVKEEEVENYEVGLKSQFFDQRLLVNVAAFYMNNHNYITNVTSLVGSSFSTYLANAQRAVSRGVELDVRAQPFEGLNTYASMIYDNAYYASFDNGPCPFERSNQTSCNFTGQPLSLVPRWAVAFGGEYSHHLGLVEPFTKPLIGYVGADFNWQSSVFSNTTNSIYSVIGAYGLLNVHGGVKFEDSSWDLSVWGQNVLNKHYFITLSETNLGTGIAAGNVGLPMTVGFTLRWQM